MNAPKYIAHELARGDTFVVFAVVGDRVHISTWFGYDIRRVVVMTCASARLRWRELRHQRFDITRRSMTVSPIYCGLDRDHVPADAVAAAYAAHTQTVSP